MPSNAIEFAVTHGITLIEGMANGLEGDPVRTFVMFTDSDDAIRFGMHGVGCAVLPLVEFMRLDKLSLVTLGWDFVTAESMAEWLRELSVRLQNVQTPRLMDMGATPETTHPRGANKQTTRTNKKGHGQ